MNIISKLKLKTIALCKSGQNDGARVVLAKCDEPERKADMTPDELQAAMDMVSGQLDDAGRAALMAILEDAKKPVEAPAEAEAKADAPVEDEEPEAKAEDMPKEDEPEAKAEAPAKDEEKADDEEDEDEGKVALAKAQSEAEALRVELAKMRDDQELREYVAKAETTMAALPGIKPAEMAVVLRSVRGQLGDDAYQTLSATLAKASDAVAGSAMMQTVGTDLGNSTGDELETKICELRKAHPDITRERALYQVAKANPGILRPSTAKE